jgi:hypothetical protein
MAWLVAGLIDEGLHASIGSGDGPQGGYDGLGHRRVEKIGLPHAARYLRLNRRCHISGHFSG